MKRLYRNLFPTGVILLAIAINAHASVKSDSLSLVYQLKQGQEFKTINRMENLIQTEAMGFSMAINQDMDMYITTKVTDSEENFTLATTMDRIVVNQKMMGMEGSYDSQTPSEPQDEITKELKKVMDQLIGKVITMQIDAKGNLLQSDYMEVFSAASSGGMLNFDNSQSWYAVYPEKKVMPGSTWQHILQMGDGEYAFNAVNTYTIKSASKKKLTLSVSTVYEPIEGSKMNEVSGTSTGTLIVDPKTGMTLSSEISQHLELLLKEEDMKVPLKMDVKITTEQFK